MKKEDASFSSDGVVILIAVHLIGFFGLHASSFMFQKGAAYHLKMFFSMIEYPGYAVLEFLGKGWVMGALTGSFLGSSGIFVMNGLLYGGTGFLLGSMVNELRKIAWSSGGLSRGSGFPSAPVEGKPAFQR
ncbi:MAG: hypothetical protein C4576_24895 [Desulfobacteraceae bacterium]|nr:MAG: hypothetical protein C4576_24895 [Desulfobacteraceae bacterium]